MTSCPGQRTGTKYPKLAKSRNACAPCTAIHRVTEIECRSTRLFTQSTKYLCTSFVLMSLIGSAIVCGAESVATSEWNITADRIIRYDNPSSIVAEGSIVLEKRVKLPPRVKPSAEQQSQWASLLGETEPPKDITAGQVDEQISEDRYRTDVVIEADWLSYDVDQKLIKARGNVKIVGKDDTLMADGARVDMNTETGSFTDAVIIHKEDKLHLEGKTIEKTGLTTYHVVDGWAVTCKVETGKTPPWSIASADTTVTEGGYAVMKHATFNIKGVPVFYSPYMIIPVKNTRQSGLLLPEIHQSSTGGFGANLPFFWNLSDSMDLTIFPEFYVDRGFMPGAEFRYVLDETSRGTFTASYLDDSLSDGDLNSSYYKDTDFTHTNSDRYWVRGKADQDIADWQTRLDIDIVSDRDYLTEFNSGYTGFSKSDDRYLHDFGRGFDNKTEDTRQNLMTALKSWDGMSLQANLLGYNDVRTDAKKARQEDPLWTLPQVNFSGVRPISSSSFSFNWVTDYVNYWREDGIGGNRIDLHPSLSTSIPLSPYLESRAEVGVRNTFYKVETYGDGVWNNDDTQNRFLGDFEMEVASPLMRTFGFSDGDSLDHRLRPYVRYNYIPDVDQDDLPDFDSVDRIDNESLITYGFDNFFSGMFNDVERDIGYVKISQGYDLLTDAEDDFTEVNLRLRLIPIPKLFVEYETDYNVYGEGFVLHSFLGAYTNSRGDYFSIDYSYNNTDEVSSKIDQINFTTRARLLPQWYTRIEVEHSIAEDETNDAKLALLYTAPCWSVEFQTEYTPSDTRYMIIFNLANIGGSLGTGL